MMTKIIRTFVPDMGYASLILLMFCGLIFAVGAILVSRLVSPYKPGKVKSEPYECGIETEGPSWVQFNVGYYLFALIFLVFDVEVVFLFPWAVVLREMGITAFIEIIIFVSILFLGLVYAWRKGALKWV